MRYFSPEHKQRISQAKTGPAPAVRFWSKVDKSGTSPAAQRGTALGLGECWLWTAGSAGEGYGIFDHVRAHRWAFQETNGPVPVGQCILHRCDTRRCVRPAHLFLGSRLDNVRDMDAKGRRTVLRGADNGRSKLTGDQVEDIRCNRENNTRLELARRHGVSKSTIDAVLTNKPGRKYK